MTDSRAKTLVTADELARLFDAGKPIVLLDVDTFWAPLITQLDRMAAVGLLKPVNRALVQRSQSPEEALGVLASAEPALAEKWITAEDR